MAYEMVMPYHLHMPSYFLETFTEYPHTKTNNTYRNELVQEKYKDQKRITFPSGEKIPYFFLRTVRKL